MEDFDIIDSCESDSFCGCDISNDGCSDGQCGFNPSFEGLYSGVEGGDLLPHYDENSASNLVERLKEPFGVYAIKNICGYTGLPENEDFPKCTLPENFTENELQDVCNKMCDCMHWKHLPVSLSDYIPNAAYSPGFFTHSTFDDSLMLNPDYARSCIEHIGSTDIVLSDMAHEIGHSIATNICGNMGTYMDEKTADFISGFINGKMGVEIDSARRWFEWYYDPNGNGGYPVSEQRWDAEAAGYYFSHLANGEDLLKALKDDDFLKIIENYTRENAETIAKEMRNSLS